tara:strand:+ start:329 stop:505 length:177 start_codon:yes stop_codon:yes gene_type:complete
VHGGVGGGVGGDVGGGAGGDVGGGAGGDVGGSGYIVQNEPGWHLEEFVVLLLELMQYW